MDKEEELAIRSAMALDVLAPLFGVGGEYLSYSLPSFDVYAMPNCEGGAYQPARNRIRLHLSNVANPLAIAEEMSHFLHDKINPLRMPRGGNYPLDYFRLVAARETVGRYGALAYLDLAGVDVTNGHLRLRSRSLTDVMDWLGHTYGYNRAEILFADHGKRLLPETARMSLEEMDKVHFIVSPEEFFKTRLREIPKIEDWLTRPLD